jgi:hypothetical protein
MAKRFHLAEFTKRWPGGIKHSFPLHEEDMKIFQPRNGHISLGPFSGEQIFISPLCILCHFHLHSYPLLLSLEPI